MSTGKALPPTLAANPRLGDWLRIGPDGTVEVRSGKGSWARAFSPRWHRWPPRNSTSMWAASE